MSGVTSAPWRDTFELDRADVRYLKLRDSAERFAALQLGVCPFRWDPAKSAFVAHPHNFFIFPHNELLNDCSSHEFLCQTTSIDFLAQYQFDFNTCFREGIYYLSRTQEEEALQKLYTLHHNETSAYPNTSEEEEDVPLKSTGDVLFTERMKIKFNEWHNSIVSNQRVDDHRSENFKFTDRFQTVFFKTRPAILLNGFTSHQLKLIRQILRKHFKDLVYVCTFFEDGISEKRVVYTDTNDDKILLMYRMRQKSKSLSSAFSLLCPALHAPDEKSSTLPPVRIEVEADETVYGYLASLQVLSMKQLCSYLGIKFKHLSPLENLATNVNLKKHINLLPPCWNSGTVLDLSTGTERPDPGYKRRYPATVYDKVVLIWGFQSKFSFADQAEAVCSTSNSEFKLKESNAADGSGAYESALDGTVPASVKQAEITKSGYKNQGDSDVSYQDILDALQDGKTLFGKRMRNT
ncbi:hypothetical protein E2562_002835 [Oryza meyeriana var. granulata]|uniref:Uncharacterized protein n=1 Tax=Oryza meyeriana var. granulata TaxID=110450 RepID=A0A6G1BRI6_9ORYZ|nr:hypothetical protein E2562_002835 [Oryza meyeriana var. granulata]